MLFAHGKHTTQTVGFSILQNLLRAHDGVADHQSKPSNLGDEDFNEDPISNYGDDTVRIIHLEKTNEPLVRTNFSLKSLIIFMEFFNTF